MQDVMQPVQQVGLTAGGWVTMILSLALVWGGVIWCFRKVLSTPEPEKQKGMPGFGP